MDYVVRDAPDGIRAHWFVSDGTLIIEISPDLDKFTRRQYIEQAKAEHDIESRRHGLLLLPLARSSHTAGQTHVAATAMIVGSGALALGAAAVVILPTVLGDSHSPARHPSAAAPPPAQPAPPVRVRPPAPAPSKPPSRPRRSGPAASPIQIDLPVHVMPVSAADPERVPGVPDVPDLHLPHPELPVSPPSHLPQPVTRRPTPLLMVSLSPAKVGVRVSVSPRLPVCAHVGSLRLRLGQARP